MMGFVGAGVDLGAICATGLKFKTGFYSATSGCDVMGRIDQDYFKAGFLEPISGGIVLNKGMVQESTPLKG